MVSAPSCSLRLLKNGSPPIMRPPARSWTKLAKTASKSRSVLARRTWSYRPRVPLRMFASRWRVLYRKAKAKKIEPAEASRLVSAFRELQSSVDFAGNWLGRERHLTAADKEVRRQDG